MLTVATVTASELDDIADALNLDPDDCIRTDYSGRGMYDQTCVGFVVADSDLLMLGVVLADILGAGRATILARNARTDSMGRDTIVYFPGVAVEDSTDA
jgi:hypothetical protein